MKIPPMKPMAMPMPASRTVKLARSIASGPGMFAHHPPSIERPSPRMQRPKGGKGPRNPME